MKTKTHTPKETDSPKQETEVALDGSTCSGFFIVDRYDRPSEEHIAERRENGYMYYIHPNLRNEKHYWAMNPDDPTPIEDFGIRIMIEGGNLHGKLIDPSRATYLDGRARKWQGSDNFSFDYPNAKRIHPHPQLLTPMTDPLTIDDLNALKKILDDLTRDLRESRGPVETTTGMIRVRVYVQQETEDHWIAKVHGSSPISHAGQTRKEAIRLALQGASVPPDAKRVHPHPQNTQ